ncbi:unnamed protein product [Rotaria sp. Silwood1]|nr:unnamed protein product [Rotaria sp. Silwood1]CAF3494680.1 unnamed protein product [Rotaria sp. Silwood1]CAF3567677.1 unnamed protein product [Rotaria sp. Silwood1]CAF4742751.1 unnamed protein product [Rotaria sp. Silwood1]CAF5015587.1 unnamed protein product [Rotaria sp. Silwood1]
MWITTEFNQFQKELFRILIPIIILVGNIGSILNVIVFSVITLLRLLQIGFNIDSSSTWSWICKLRFFAVGFLLMLPRSYILLAAIDREIL